MSRLSLAIGAGILLASGSAFGLGTFITDAGSGTALDASRTAFVRSGDSLRMVSQVRYAGSPTKLLWLIAIPNFNEPADDGVLVTRGEQAALDALATATRPTFEGVCDGMPSGNMGTAPQSDTWGPTPNMALPQRLFSVPDLIDGDLNAYAESLGVVIDEDAQTVIDTVIDQNFMLVTLSFDAAAVGVNKVDPVVDIVFPRAAGQDIPLALFPTNTAVPAGNADMVIFTLGGTRFNASLTTREIDFAEVSFVAPNETNYLPAFDALVGTRQTQMFITEQASGIDGAFGEPTLDGWIGESGATFQTRLRARLSGPALRANKFITLAAGGQGPYASAHEVAGFMCGGDMPDMGMVDADMGVDQTDMAGEGGEGGAGGAGGEGGGATADAGPTEPEGGGDDGGCSVSRADAPTPWFLLGALLLFPIRRRVRSAGRAPHSRS